MTQAAIPAWRGTKLVRLRMRKRVPGLTVEKQRPDARRKSDIVQVPKERLNERMSFNPLKAKKASAKNRGEDSLVRRNRI